MRREDLIVERYTSGVSVKEIARELQVSDTSVYAVLNKQGVEFRRKPVYSMDVMMSVVEAYNTGRHTVRQIADKYGVSNSVVCKWVQLAKNGMLGHKTRGRGTHVDLERMKDLYQQGCGIRKIGEIMGVTPSTIKHHLQSAGIYEGKNHSSDTRSKYSESDIARLIELYTTTSGTVSEIAETCGINAGTARQLLHLHGVKRPEHLKMSPGKPSFTESASATDVISDYKTGLFSHAEIAERYGVSTRTVSRILDKAGVEAMTTQRVVSASDVARVLPDVRADLDGGLDSWSVAIKHGLPLHTVEKVVAGGYDNLRVTRSGETVVSYYKPVKREKGVVEKCESKGTKADRCRSQILELHALGKKPPAIAEELGLSSPTVRSVLKEAGVGKVKKQVEKKGSKSDRMKDDILRLHKEGKDAVRIAQELGVSAPTVRKVLSSAESHVATSVETHVEPAVEPMTVAPSKFMVDMITNVWKRRGDVEAVAAETGMGVEMVKAILKKEVGV